jgi:hypothetical protein
MILFIVSIAVALWMLIRVGNQVCRILLDWSGLTQAMQAKSAPAASPPPATPAPASHPRVGQLIGTCERLLIAAGVLAGSWEILAAVIALKTVARFKELDEKLDAEYFLVGSLFSVAWAIAITYAWIGFDHTWGYDLVAKLRPAD